MRILFIGDVYGRSGREALEQHLPTLIRDQKPDMVIVNGENAANGIGITEKIAKEFYELGTDIITTGNHVWGQREVLAYITREPRLLRPANYPKDTPGAGVVKYQTASGQKITVINMMGQIYMDILDNPFHVIDDILKEHRLGQNTDAIFIDLHAEVTSEKMAFAHYCDGRVTGVVGTHTHIPTADAHILPQGTAYQTDAGMTGPYDSIIGAEKNIPIHRFTKKTPTERMRPAKGEGTVCGTLIDTNDETGLATNIQPIRIGGILSSQIPAS